MFSDFFMVNDTFFKKMYSCNKHRSGQLLFLWGSQLHISGDIPDTTSFPVWFHLEEFDDAPMENNG